MNHFAEISRLYQLHETEAVQENSLPTQLIPWALRKFAGQKLVITTSFGMEGCALIDMFAQSNIPADLTISYIDTGFFFPETHSLRKKMEARYSQFRFEAWESPISIEKQSQSYGKELWKDNPNLCCHIRKVVPMAQNVKNYDIWITALRRTQTEQRASIAPMQWDWRYQLLKFCPFANWTRKDVWKYVQDHDVPFNRLHLQGYPSIGCFHCTKPIQDATPDSDNRSGRWNGNEKTECGLHYSI